jgi:AraC-like DNA-binding protein/quercetin dioxygenase-like cupin family protein
MAKSPTTMARSSENLAISPARHLFHQNDTYPAGHTVSLHSHLFWQMELVLSGRILARAGDTTWDLAAGAVLVIPPGLEHGFRHQAARNRFFSFKFDLDIPPPAAAWLPERGPLLTAMVQALLTAAAEPAPPPATRLVLGHLLSAVCACGGGAAEYHPAHPLLHTLDLHLRRHGRTSVAGLAAAVGLSPSRLRVRFRQLAGSALKPWIDRHLATSAQEMLAYADLSVGEIATRLGFEDPFAFSRSFRRTTGESPRDYRQRSRHRGTPPDRE